MERVNLFMGQTDLRLAMLHPRSSASEAPRKGKEWRRLGKGRGRNDCAALFPCWPTGTHTSPRLIHIHPPPNSMLPEAALSLLRHCLDIRKLSFLCAQAVFQIFMLDHQGKKKKKKLTT